ncbi:MAG: T9SS type A sorting domain-containing protein [Leadbetterella sp.]
MLSSVLVFGQNSQEKSRLLTGTQPAKVVKAPVFNPSKTLSASKLNSFRSSTGNYYRKKLLSKDPNVAESKNVNPTIESSNPLPSIEMTGVYPNPAVSYADIDLTINHNFSTAKISFYNLLGRNTANYEVKKNTDKITINVSSWESGMYMYQLVVDNKKVATKKLIVNHN